MESPVSSLLLNNVEIWKEVSSTISSWWELEQFQGHWYYKIMMGEIKSTQENFKADPSDIIIASAPKTGATWLKALAFAIVTRSRFGADCTYGSPLLAKLPHDCVPLLEYDMSNGKEYNGYNRPELGQPLVATHLPYTSLPKSVVDCGCKIVYIWRDLKDTFVSMWHFTSTILKSKGLQIMTPSIEEDFDKFCKGFVNYGPYWDHILGYWKASSENPDNVLFLKYEKIKNDPFSYVKKLAEFMGHPFTLEEEEAREVEKIVNMCSFENMSNLDVNKSGKHREGTYREVENCAYFRKGEVGDWRNHLTAEMGARLDKIVEEKFTGSGLIV